MKKIIIAIDGPAGSGKTTTARETAKRLGYIYIDTGAMYRAVTLAWLRKNTELKEEILYSLMDDISIELKPTDNGQMTLLNGEDVSEDIRSPEVTKNVSPVSAVGCVREKLVNHQRMLGKNGGVVLDGRDIGTVVFPEAELKIYLVASIEARAKRRNREFNSKGTVYSELEIQKLISDRDHYDSSRENSPLKKAEDAIEIDTSNISIGEQTEMVYSLALSRIEKIK